MNNGPLPFSSETTQSPMYVALENVTKINQPKVTKDSNILESIRRLKTRNLILYSLHCLDPVIG